MRTVLRHLLAILLLPTLVAGVLPSWLLRAFAEIDSRWLEGSWLAWPGRTLGIASIAVGLGLLGWCISLFARVGQGTLAPWDPTRRLVAVGPYQYVRNPMISGVALLLLGQALLWGSWVLGLWCGVFILLNHTYFVLSEEPGLEQRFGAAYREYKASVPRWLPRRRSNRR